MTDFLKLILIVDEEELLPNHTDENFEMIEISHLTKDQAIE